MTHCIKPPGRIQDSKGDRHDVSCKMRNCPVCSRVLRQQLIHRVNAFFGDQQVYFNTFTLQTDNNGDIMRYWNLIQQRIKYYYPHMLIFWTKEYTRAGKAHLHFISSRSIDGAWASREWFRITGNSYVVKCGNTSSEVKNPGAYMLKYLTKAHNGLDMFEKNERIYGFLGAKAPPVEKLGFESACVSFELDQHYNLDSKYWQDWYNERQIAYGRPFVETMAYYTLAPMKRYKIDLLRGFVDENYM